MRYEGTDYNDEQPQPAQSADIYRPQHGGVEDISAPDEPDLAEQPARREVALSRATAVIPGSDVEVVRERGAPTTRPPIVAEVRERSGEHPSTADEILADEPKINIIGGTRGEVDRQVTELVLAKTERPIDPVKRPVVVTLAPTAPQDRNATYLHGQGMTVHSSEVQDTDGVYAALSPKQRATALAHAATAAAGPNQPVAAGLTSRTILTSIADRLAEGGHSATPKDFRDAMRLLRGDVPYSEIGLTPDQRELVKDAIPPDRADEYKPHIAQLGGYLDLAITDPSGPPAAREQHGRAQTTSDGTVALPAEEPPEPASDNPVLRHVALDREVYSDPLRHEAQILALATALPYLINHPDPTVRPDLLVLTEMQHASGAALPLVVRAAAMCDDNGTEVVLAARGASNPQAFGPMDQPGAAFIVNQTGPTMAGMASRLIGSAIGPESVTGRSYSESGNVGTGSNTGSSANYRATAVDARGKHIVETGGASTGDSTSLGTSYSVTTQTSSTLFRLKQEELEQIQRGQCVVVTSDGTVHGLYATDGERITPDFPVREAPEPVQDRIRRIEGAMGALAAPQADALPAGTPPPALPAGPGSPSATGGKMAPPAGLQRPLPASRPQWRTELERQHADHGRPGSLEDFALTRHFYPEWRQQHGSTPPTKDDIAMWMFERGLRKKPPR